VSQERFIQIISEFQHYCDQGHPNNILFKFENTIKATSNNAMILKQFNYNLQEAISAQQNSQVMFGSKFKHPIYLE
jgi:hypothetical protein